MAVGSIPVPLNHPVIDARTGLITRPWSEYFLALARGTDSSLTDYMAKATYDPTNSGSVVDSDKLGGYSLAQVLDLGNATGRLDVGLTAWSVRQTSTSTGIVAGEYLDCDATVAAFTVVMPSASQNSGKVVAVTKSDASANAITVSAADNINGSATYPITTRYQSVVFVSNGTEWRIL